MLLFKGWTIQDKKLERMFYFVSGAKKYGRKALDNVLPGLGFSAMG